MADKKLKQCELNDWKNNNKYPLLYTDTSVGKRRVWACWVIGSSVFRTDGLIDGKIKDPVEHKYAGNTLRTPEEQAEQEAEKKWIGQLKKGYAPDSTDKAGMKIYEHVQEQQSQNGGMNRGVKMWGSAITVKTTAGKKDLAARHIPMLAKKYKDWNKKTEELELTNPGKKLKFPVIGQPKVDGIRSLAYVDDSGKVMLESRNGNAFVHLQHVRNEIKHFLKEKKLRKLVLDGEFYVHQLYRDAEGNPTLDHTDREMENVERFQFVSEVCKVTRSNPHKYESLVEYWIFDIWDPEKTNEKRWKMLTDAFANYDGDILKMLPTRLLKSHDEIEDYMAEMVGETNGREGYEFEGIMLRQSGAKYISRNNYHCDNLLKFKRFEDEEWAVAGAEQCEGSHEGAIKWKLEKKVKGKMRTVTAKQMGKVTDSCKLWTDYKKSPQKFKGRQINIRFNDRSKDGVPRFPRATAFVEDKD